jgi:hypothetical protein
VAIIGCVANYDDGRVALTDDEIVIRQYYAFAGTRHIKYSEIREARQISLGMMGKWRISGSGDFRHWFNFDPKRPRKNTGFVLYLDGFIRPVITPDDPASVATELAGHGLKVTSGTESGAV